MDFDGIENKIKQRAEDLDAAFKHFRQKQTELGSEVTFADKDALKRRLHELKEDLSRYLAKDYGIDCDQPNLEVAAKYDAWKYSHKPFHWLVEFYGIINDGGFDAIIGNPPYVEYSKIIKGDKERGIDGYTVKGYATIDCGNIYAYFCERNLDLLSKASYHGMIIPHSAFCTDRMSPIIDKITSNSASWISTYSIRPAKLFAGVDQRLAIYICTNSVQETYSTNFYNWSEVYRSFLIPCVNYIKVNDIEYPNSIAKTRS